MKLLIAAKKCREYYPIILLIILLILFFWKPLFLPYTMTLGDLIYYEDFLFIPYRPDELPEKSLNPLLGDQTYSFYPWLHYAAERIKNHQIPLWNPYSSTGAPFLANLQSAVFDPIRLVLLYFLPTYKIPVFYNILKLFIAGLFTYLYCRKIGFSQFSSSISMLTFSFGGFMLVWLGHPHTGVACWLPVMFYFTELWFRSGQIRHLIIFSLVLSFQFFAGHIATSWHIILAVSLYFLYRWYGLWKSGHWEKPYSPFLWYALAGIAGILLASIQLIPFLEYLINSSVYHNRTETALAWFHPFHWLGDIDYFKFVFPTILVSVYPDIFGNPILHNDYFRFIGPLNYTEQILYIGLLPFLFIILITPILINRSAIFIIANGTKQYQYTQKYYAIFFILLAILSLGIAYRLPLFNIINHLPIFNIIRNERIRLLYTFSGAILSGFAIDYFIQNYRNNQLLLTRLIKILYGFIFLSLFLFIAIRYLPGSLPLHEFMISPAIILPLFLGLTALLIFSLYAKNKISIALLKIFILIFIISDLFSFGYQFNPSVKKDILYPLIKPVELILKNNTMDRVIGLGATGRGSINLIYPWKDIRACDPMRVWWHDNYLENNFNVEYLWDSLVWVNEINEREIDFLSVRYILSGEEIDLDKYNFNKIYYNEYIYIYENPERYPRAFIVYPQSNISDLNQYYPMDLIITLSPNDTTGRIINEPLFYSPESNVHIVQYEPEKIRLTLFHERPGYLILNDTYFPGWKAYINGKETEIYCANKAFRAISIPTGQLDIIFQYKPDSFRYGKWISFITLLILIVMLVLNSRFTRTKMI